MSNEALEKWAANSLWTRRRLIGAAGVAGLGLGAAALIGCGGDDDDDDGGAAPAAATTAATTAATAAAATATAAAATATAAATAAPTPAAVDPPLSELLSVHWGTREHPDPHTGSVSSPWTHVGDVALDIKRDTFEVQPRLFESWEQPSATEYVFSMAQGVLTHDRAPSNGRVYTTEDAAYSIERITGKYDPDNVTLYQRRTELGPLISAEAVDETSVRVLLDSPFSPFLIGLANHRNPMVPKDFAESGGFSGNISEALPVGTGPYVLEELRNGEGATFNRFPNYWRGKGAPYFERVEWSVLPDDSARASAFAAGAIDFYTTLSKAGRQTIETLADDYNLISFPSNRIQHLDFNISRKPVDDVRIRRALQRVLDYAGMGADEYGDGFWDYSGPAGSAYPDAFQAEDIKKMPGWNPDTKDADTVEARQLMSAAGFPDGSIELPITSVAPGGGNVAAIMASQAVRIQHTLTQTWPAMNVTIDVVPGSEQSQRRGSGEFVALAQGLFGPLDVVLGLLQNFGSDGSRNWREYSNPEVDGLLARAVQETDPDARREMIRSAEGMVIDDTPMLIVARLPVTHYVNPAIMGYHPGPAGLVDFDLLLLADRYWKA